MTSLRTHPVSSRCLAAFALALALGWPAGQARAQGVLPCGGFRDGRLRTAERHYWTFEAEAGDRVLIHLVTTYDSNTNTCNGSFSALAELLGPGSHENPVLAGVVGLIPFDIPETGVYTLRVHDSNYTVGCAGFGDYRVGLEWLWPIESHCDKKVLLCGERLGNNVRTSQQDFYSISSQAGDLLTVTLVTTYDSNTNTCNGSFAARASLYGPDVLAGALKPDGAAPADPAEFTGNQQFTLPTDGTYTLRVYDLNLHVGCAGFGTYALNVTRTQPICDCNNNSTPDDADIDGPSRDDNDNLVPDECEPAALARIEPGPPETPNLVRVLVSSNILFRGGQLAFAYDANVLTSLVVERGTALPANAQLEDDLDLPLTGCPADPAVNRGLTAGWVNSQNQNVTTPLGLREVLKIRYTPAPGVEAGDCSPFKFIDCLGGATPFPNVLVNAVGESREVVTADGEACTPFIPVPFRRGDANMDGTFDIGDPIAILICLFLNTGCSQCRDARDANDDGNVDIADPAYLINWRFNQGPSPTAPFPACGADPTAADSLGECLGVTCS